MTNILKFDKQGRLQIPERKIEYTPKIMEIIKEAKEYNEENYKIAIKELKEFQNRFFIEKIKELTLETYCYGFKNSFCWWIEKGTMHIAHMLHEGFSREYGIWFSNKKKKYCMTKGKECIEISEDTAKRELEDIKMSIISIINFAKDNKFIEIEEEKGIWHQFKTKIIYLYFPNKILPILSRNTLKNICNNIDVVNYRNGNHLGSSNNLLNSIKLVEPFKNWDSLKISLFLCSIYKEK